ncbi:MULTISPECIES: NAD-dependent epimerase/dehydratase family protein [Pseudonocardia]|uniref:NAD dependent epimerase/dehydratase family protein n=2 Tax=Pseudonocardia TaxID=1847 RepID=A0A1Y2MIP7_PSEAH|nr:MULTISPECIES: NAD-dependent epimerase/dehydratase family protein [Pseudonocardia]OSY34941.1 NAD dependent epimerase/dehydratase family protein [Pseudonocardia autotrophica]TDN72534.1 nucleoside-diphosphate-sugar epimerase [Pseudonocardia autotrophica]BBG03243.1 NAD-dependent epimerase [Pseudonocardia autotrophica]GEC29652.1 NAD-dependent epimerase [Pseudonocardia saturnea]
MSRHVVVGAGAVGSAVATALAARGEQVRIVSRRGGGPEHPSIEPIATDVTGRGTLARLTGDAVALYDCAAPPYHRWPEEWPPLAGALLEAAEHSGAVLVSAGNLYLYGPVTGPMTEHSPIRPAGAKARVRAQVWQDALDRHRAGRIRTVEVRASDHLGAGSRSLLTGLVLPRLLAGRRAFVPADLDAPHTWTAVSDVARTMVAVAAAPATWGRAWHVPSADPVSIREIAVLACRHTGSAAPRLHTLPRAALWLGGLTDPTVRALRETQYQFRAPFLLDSTEATATLGIAPTPVAESLAETVEALGAAHRSRSATS